MNDQAGMKIALRLAAAAQKKGEVPVGAVVIQGDRVVAKAHNLTRTIMDPTAHAEMVAIREAAAALKNERLIGCDLYVTLEPCAMCAGAIVQARVGRVIYGAEDPKAGACGSVFRVIPNKKLNHRPLVIKEVLADESSRLLKRFFKARRRAPKGSLT
ncbi:MAG: nucleoside deaminase [Elusimicrobia bacterium]|nr:nucleoside deaminase [Elusimicrobiota bacterium]